MRPVGLGDSFVRRQEQSAWGGRHAPLPPPGRACPQVDVGGSAPAGRSPPRPVPGAPVRVALDARSAGGLLAAHGGHGAPTPPRPQGPTASVLQVPPRSLCRRRWPPRDQTLHPCAVWRAR